MPACYPPAVAQFSYSGGHDNDALPGESVHPTIVISGSLAFDYIMTYRDHFRTISFQTRRMSSPLAFCLIHYGGTGAASPEILPTTSRFSGSDRRLSAQVDLILGTIARRLNRSASTRHGSSMCLQSSLVRPSCQRISPAIRSRAFTLGHRLPRRIGARLGRGAVFGMVGATTREAMQRHAREFAESGCRLIYDASQQVVSLSADELREGIDQAGASSAATTKWP